jgi:putative addiction module component (TIGR02574 family)
VLAEDLPAKALRFPRSERARLAEQVLSSLEESEEEVAEAWASELERRSRDIAASRVQTVDWDIAQTSILKELEQTECGCSSS